MNKRAENFGLALAGLVGLLSATYANRPERGPETLIDRVGRDKFVCTDGEIPHADKNTKIRTIKIYRRTSGFFEKPAYEQQDDYTIRDAGADGTADLITIVERDARFNGSDGSWKVLARPNHYRQYADEFENADQILQNYKRICIEEGAK